MFLTHWLHSVHLTPTVSPKTGHRARSRKRRPSVEVLEDRTLLSFAAAVSYPVGIRAQQVAIADFNRDGRPDLVTTNFFADRTVNVLLGNGDGTFQEAQYYALGIGGWALGVGDFDGDGAQDLAVGEGGGNRIKVLLGNGDGTFRPGAQFISHGTEVRSMAVRDFDGDGRLDLAAVVRGFWHLNIHLGNGDGTFRPAVGYASNYYPNSVAAGDFNGDGWIDLVVANETWASNGNVNVFLGNGDGTFRPRQPYQAADKAQAVSVGDFDGDGHPDLAVANHFIDSSSVSVFRNNADGTGTFQITQHYPTGPGSSMVAVGDFNGDCRADLVVTNSGGSTVSLLLNNGDGTFQAAQNFTVGRDPRHAVVGDFNGDGSPDLAVANWGQSFPMGEGTVSVLLNTTVPEHRPPVLSAIPNQTVNEGSTLTLAVLAADPDADDTLTYSLVNGPVGASIDPVTGVFTWTPDDGPATVSVTVRVTDSSDCAHSDTRTFTVTVLNVAPTPGISGPSGGTIGQTLTFTLTASDVSAADQAAGFTYVIDWGDGSPLQTIDAFPGSGSGVPVSHAYAAPGAYAVHVTAIDKDGGAGMTMLAEPIMIAPVPTGVSDLSWSGGGIVTAATVAAGEAFTIGRTFAVGGEPVGPFTIAYWASLDDIFGNEDDFLLGVELLEGAAPGIHSGSSPAFTIAAAGTYRLFAVLDSDGQIDETNEDNNLVMALATLLVTDLQKRKG